MTAENGDAVSDSLLALLNSNRLLCDVGPVAEAFEVNKFSYYSMVQNGTAPVMPIMVGRRQKYRIADLRRVLGLEAEMRPATPDWRHRVSGDTTAAQAQSFEEGAMPIGEPPRVQPPLVGPPRGGPA